MRQRLERSAPGQKLFELRSAVLPGRWSKKWIVRVKPLVRAVAPLTACHALTEWRREVTQQLQRTLLAQDQPDCSPELTSDAKSWQSTKPVAGGIADEMLVLGVKH